MMKVYFLLNFLFAFVSIDSFILEFQNKQEEMFHHLKLGFKQNATGLVVQNQLEKLPQTLDNYSVFIKTIMVAGGIEFCSWEEKLIIIIIATILCLIGHEFIEYNQRVDSTTVINESTVQLIEIQNSKTLTIGEDINQFDDTNDEIEAKFVML